VWLWNNHLPAGQLVMAAGYEKLGKSTALIWIGARLTRGDLPVDFQGEPLDVCYVSAEDDAAHILKPRIVAAGADVDRFYVLNPDPKAEGFSRE
jgi:RecA-family ATPase